MCKLDQNIFKISEKGSFVLNHAFYALCTRKPSLSSVECSLAPSALLISSNPAALALSSLFSGFLCAASPSDLPPFHPFLARTFALQKLRSTSSNPHHHSDQSVAGGRGKMLHPRRTKSAPRAARRAPYAFFAAAASTSTASPDRRTAHSTAASCPHGAVLTPTEPS